MIEYSDDIINALMKMPGVGEKSATRYLNVLLNMNDLQLNEFLNSINKLRLIKKCIYCCNFSIEDLCNICMEKRNSKVLVVVEHASDILIIENVYGSEFEYFVLGGVIDPLKNINIDDLNFLKLNNRVNTFSELLIMLPSTTQGEVTTNYIINLFKNEISISRLAQGVPIGSSITYIDDLTLYKSIQKRSLIEE